MNALILPTSMTMGLLSFALIARWYLWPALRALPRNDALTALVLVHAFRYIGLAFLIEGVTARALDPRFAVPAACGDLAAAVLALIAVAALRRGWASAAALTWLFNVVGTLDLLNAVFRGLRYTEDAHLGATYFIPALIVPALLVTHALIFLLQTRPEHGADRGGAAADRRRVGLA